MQGQRKDDNTVFYVNDKLKAQRDLVLNEGQIKVDFEHRFTKAGFNRVYAKLGKYNLDIDNHYTRAIMVGEKVSILLIDTEGESSQLNRGG